MKPWIYLGAFLSSSLIGIWVWIDQRRRQQEAAELDQLLASHTAALRAKRSGQVLDETKQAKAQARREIVASLDRRSALVASGSSSASVLKMVKRA